MMEKMQEGILRNGGWSEIRTHGGRKPSTVFKTVAFNRSAIHPLIVHCIFQSLSQIIVQELKLRRHN